jgi:hypothetical protein
MDEDKRISYAVGWILKDELRLGQFSVLKGSHAPLLCTRDRRSPRNI